MLEAPHGQFFEAIMEAPCGGCGRGVRLCVGLLLIGCLVGGGIFCTQKRKGKLGSKLSKLHRMVTGRRAMRKRGKHGFPRELLLFGLPF